MYFLNFFTNLLVHFILFFLAIYKTDADNGLEEEATLVTESTAEKNDSLNVSKCRSDIII